jgi:hypothetical protein
MEKIKKELMELLEKEVEKKAFEHNLFDNDRVTITLDLTEEQKETFLELYLNDYVFFEFEGNTLYFTTCVNV